MHSDVTHPLVPKVTIDYVTDYPTELLSVAEEIKGYWKIDKGHDDIVINAEKVTLPSKFIRLQACMNLEREQIIQECREDDGINDADIALREKDCDLALRWIRQEICAMKEQDKSLLKQFIDLRTKILRLRCLYDVGDCYSGGSSLTGSTSSLNEQGKLFPLQRLTVGNDFVTPINMKQSVSLPSSPQVRRVGLGHKGSFANGRASQWNMETDDG